MKAIFGELTVIALALLMIACAVFWLNDSSILVSPPEAVAEGFMRQLVTGRYEQATEYLSDELKSQVSRDRLKQIAEAIKARAGKIIDVRGEPVSIDGGAAEAAAMLKTERGQTPRVRFLLSRKQGEWLIGGLGNLEAGAIQ